MRLVEWPNGSWRESYSLFSEIGLFLSRLIIDVCVENGNTYIKSACFRANRFFKGHPRSCFARSCGGSLNGPERYGVLVPDKHAAARDDWVGVGLILRDFEVGQLLVFLVAGLEHDQRGFGGQGHYD